MFDHIGIVVSDLVQSRDLYSSILEPLGFRLLEDHTESRNEGWLVYGNGAASPFFVVSAGRPSFWTDKHSPGISPIHCAFIAPATESVDRFHKLGLAHGATDNGAPGDRGRGYYAAFLIDPDGNNIEVGHRSQSDVSDKR